MGKIMKIKELCDNERAKSKKYLKYLKKKKSYQAINFTGRIQFLNV